jgi:hypothetical protein
MDSLMRAAIGGQLGAAINTLREAIEQCPDTLWDDRSEGAPFWQIAYHTLVCLDMYSSPSLKAFTPTTFHVKDAQFLAGDYPWLDPPRTIGVPAQRSCLRSSDCALADLTARFARRPPAQLR